MNYFKKLRIQQILKYGWKDSNIIHKETGRSRLCVFLDILNTFRMYYVFSMQYKKHRLWELSPNEFSVKALELGRLNKHHDQWWVDYYENRNFLNKWMKYDWETTPQKVNKRAKAYQHRYNTGKNLSVQYNVDICREHCLDGTLTIGDNVLLAKNVFIDYSGDVTIGDDVRITNGVIIETHHHPFHSDYTQSRSIVHPTTLKIEDGAVLGSRCIILPSCHYIGKHARVGAGAVVTKDVPDYAVAVGVPAKVVKIVEH